MITIQPEENAAEINIDIYAYSDGIDAAYDVVIDENGIDSKGNDVSGTITINIYTYSYASSKLNTVQTVIQSAGPGGFGGGMPGGFNGGMGQGGGGQGPSEDGNTDKLDISAKGIKADNEITISGGTFVISAYDDAIHANNDEELENSETPLGNVTITGGTFTIMTHDDGIHADGTLEITDGEITIGTLTNNTVYEGLEGNVINFKGGKAVVIAKDDGVNATSGSKTPAINVSGGLLDVTVPSSGDVDGIDSNGTYTQTGGVVITRGPNSEMSAAIDADSTKVIYGGTLIILGYGSIQRGSGVSLYSMSLHSSGSKTVNIGGTSYSFTNGNYSYGRTTVYSSVAVS
ncbi:MAG: carbohydrate-binding domain-containing protein [Clostridia bacterium]|nr:carbohydrate-binding domain-containing protein [Clostridia bacterium]